MLDHMILDIICSAESLHATRPDLAAMPEPTRAELDYASRYTPADVRRIDGAEMDTRTTQEMEVCR